MNDLWMTDDVRMFLDRVAPAALCCPPTIDNTWDLCADAARRRVQGAFVECGVFGGAHPAIMARAVVEESRHENTDRHARLVHLFDSFCGIPMAGPNDDESITGCIGVPPPGKADALETTGISACTLDAVKAHMASWGIPADMLVYHEGWFQETVPRDAKAVGPIAVLRLDGDLYSSTKVCLEHLYPLLAAGGYCIVDDYALTGCHRAVTEYLSSIGETPKIIPVEGGLGVSYWQR